MMFGSAAPGRARVSVQMMPWQQPAAPPPAPMPDLSQPAAPAAPGAQPAGLMGNLGPLLAKMGLGPPVANGQAPGLAQLPPTLASMDPGPAGQVSYSPRSIATLLQQLHAQGLGAGGLSGFGG